MPYSLQIVKWKLKFMLFVGNVSFCQGCATHNECRACCAISVLPGLCRNMDCITQPLPCRPVQRYTGLVSAGAQQKLIINTIKGTPLTREVFHFMRYLTHLFCHLKRLWVLFPLSSPSFLTTTFLHSKSSENVNVTHKWTESNMSTLHWVLLHN